MTKASKPKPHSYSRDHKFSKLTRNPTNPNKTRNRFPFNFTLTTHLVSSSDNSIFVDSAATISQMNSHFSALTCRDTHL
ncbi:F-box protein [Corchorus olitorius]|uniref:F-box protein n=1 Tax=Corchorus olitorius TaxID=93759 RepID=A0A1R3K8T1_9ROSI|nr:F-box protein [Corchorus olitorius]